MKDHPVVKKGSELIELETRALSYLQTPLWTLMRFYFGFAFAITGYGKLTNIEQVANWFGNSLGIPFPLANAYAAATTELVGGIALMIGLGGRVLTIPLVVTMIVAYATADAAFLDPLYKADTSLFDKIVDTADKFISATPFTFLLASLFTLVWGSGAWSVDAWIAKQIGYEGPEGSGPQ